MADSCGRRRRKKLPVTPNQAERACYANGTNSIEETLAHLFQRGVHNVMLKQGSDGALLVTAEGSLHFPCRPSIPLLRETLSNDAFAVGHMRRLELAESARLAAAAAGISVSRPGAQVSLPSEDEVRLSFASIVESPARETPLDPL
jgi:ribokinase